MDNKRKEQILITLITEKRKMNKVYEQAEDWATKNFDVFSKTNLEIKQGLKLAFIDGNRSADLTIVTHKFFEDMATKHNVKIGDLNLHVSMDAMYVQEYRKGELPEFRHLEIIKLVPQI